MQTNEQLAAAIRHAGGFTDKLLSEFTEETHWMRRPCPDANHATWVVGHLALTSDFFVGLVSPDKRILGNEYGALFGKGTIPEDDASAYPAGVTLASILKERRGVLLELLGACSEEDFEREVSGGPAFIKNVRDVFQTAAWHETLHSGQLTVAHRAIGKSPLADR